MSDCSWRIAVVEFRALLAGDAQINLHARRRLILRGTSCIANAERATLCMDFLEAVLLSR